VGGAGIPDTVAAHLARLLSEASTAGIEEAVLPVRLGATPAAISALLGADRALALRIGGRVYAPAAAAGLRNALRTLLNEHHRTHPLEPGVSLQSIRGKLTGAAELIDAVLSEALAAAEVATDGGVLRRGDWQPVLTAAEMTLRARLVDVLRDAGREPPSVGELITTHGDRVAPLLRLVERAGAVTAVEPDRYYATNVVEQLIDSLRREMVPGREYGPAEMRELLGVSRKYLIPLLEYCDRMRVTDRRPGGRVIVGTQFASHSGDKRS
jgi:selenocysteine-specific elongation factor